MRRAIISVLIGTATLGAPTVAHSQSTPPRDGQLFQRCCERRADP